jgi:hypothetical protein
MSWDNLHITFYLTSNGWESNKLARRDALWVVDENVYQRSGWSQEEITWSASEPRGSIKEIKALLRQFPYPGNPSDRRLTKEKIAKLLRGFQADVRCD